MNNFRDQNWNSRFTRMGDEAERVFEQTYPQRFERYGLDRPDISLARVPAFVRYTPDYLTAKGLVEVQGFGREQLFRLKLEKFKALQRWGMEFRVDFFLWDSHFKRHAWVRLDDLSNYYWTTVPDIRVFPEGKEYWAVTADSLPIAGEWRQYNAESPSPSVPPQDR